MNAEEMEFLKKTMRKKSRYAGYWEELDKRDKEVAVVEDLLIAIYEREGRDWIKSKSIESSDNDPPDVIGITKVGARVAFEVTELVEESKIIENTRAQSKRKNWQTEEIISRLQSIIAEKGFRDYGRKSFGLVILVIHTAEKGIMPDRFGPAIIAHKFVRCGQIDEAYLIFKPRPMSTACSYFRLSFK